VSRSFYYAADLFRRRNTLLYGTGKREGGQAYSEFLFFQDAIALEDFKRGNFEMSAQVSAVAVTAGASADADYNSGIAVFAIAKGGLMYEASVGGQKFKVESK
jgi:hypothetical protein